MEQMEGIENKRTSKSIKIIFIVLSIIVVVFSLTGNIITSNKGSVALISFESFYIYIVAVIIALYMTLNNKNSNIALFIALLTYLWTYYLVHQMLVMSTDVKMTLGSAYYIYLSSSIFLILSLFFNDKKTTDDNLNSTSQNLKDDFSNNFIFTNFVSGIKGLPLNTMVLLVNDTTNNSVNLVYSLSSNDKDSQTIKLPINIIKNVTFNTKVKMQNINKKVEENETKSMLLSTVVFGGNPLMQLLGNSGFNNLFNSLSNNYNKVDYNTYYEIVIETSINGQDVNLIFHTDTNPEIFIKDLPNK